MQTMKSGIDPTSSQLKDNCITVPNEPPLHPVNLPFQQLPSANVKINLLL